MPSLSVSEVSSIVEKAIKNSNPRELPLKGLHFGQLWHEAGDYQNATQWITKYLRAYDRDAQAHRLLGECYEKLSEYESALKCYKQSLHIKPLQPQLVLHIVELFLNPGPTQNPNRAQVWLDKAAAALPGHPSVFKLKMELLVAQQASPDTLEKAIKQELKLRDNDFSLHEEYISFLKTQGNLSAANSYCNELENIQLPHSFCDSLEWCSCVVSTYQDYYEILKAKSTSAHELLVPRFLLLEALARYLRLCISDRNFDKSFQLLQILDEVTYAAASQSISGEWHIMEEEMKAQLAWLSASLMLHQVDMRRIPSSEGRGLCLVLYAYSLSKPVPGLTTAWAVNCRRAHPHLPARLMRNAGMRVSECSHMVHILDQSNGIKALLQNTNMDLVGQNVCHYLWPNTTNTQCSFLWNSKTIARSRISIPPIDDMLYFDQISSTCANLHNIVWLGIRWCKLDHPSDFLPWVQQIFPKLRLASNTDVKSGALVLTTGLMDIEAFVASCVYTTEKQIEVWSETYQDQKIKGFESPPSLIRKLTTELQEKWWQAAIVLSAKEKPKQSAAELSKLKPLLLRGLESIRGMGSHGLQTMLATKLAKYFESKAFLLREEGGISSGWFAYQRRAAVYWSLVLPDLQRATEGRVLHKPKTKDALFPNVFQEPKCDDATSLLSDANMCHGELAAEENRIEDALTFYGKATMPQASFCQAHIYKKLSDNAVKSSLSQSPLSDGEKQKGIYFKKYKHCLEVTLTRLQQHPDDKLHERTVSLLASLQLTPPRAAVDKSKNDSILPGPSKQSTPKLDESVTNSVLSTLVEKDSVTNLVDSLATLTSAVSSLKLEMGQLREESKVRQYSASPSFTSQTHATPQRVVHPEHLGNLAMPMTPPMYQTMQDGIVRPAPTLTPQRAFIAQQSSMYPSVGRDGRISTPADQASYIDAYQQQQQLQQHQLLQQQAQQIQQQAQQIQQQAQQQALYTPIASSAYYSNYQYQSYTPEAMINGHAMAAMPAPQAYSGATYTPEPKPVNTGYNQQSNVLAACLQNKASTDALQQRLGSALAGITSSPVSAHAKPQPQPQPQIKPPSMANLAGNQQTPPISGENLQQIPTTKVAPQAVPHGKTSLIQQLLQSDSTPKPTPQVPKKDVEFLSKFVTPKSGIEHKFQSPEQMDRENQELEALENADNETSNNNDTGPHFEPIVSLPEVETRTGEEDEEVLFLERCRLFRWVDEQWKERGVGDMKVLRHKSTGKSRLVMRRDQVHKVCCNHFISSSLTLTPMQSSERALVWTALDFSDGESKNEQLAARFKTSEIANKFKVVVSVEASKAGSTQEAQPSLSVGKGPSPETGENKQTVAVSQKSTPSSIAAAASSFKFVMPKPSELQEKTTAAPEPETSKPSVFTGLAGALTQGFAGAGPEGGIKPGSFKFSFGAPKPRTIQETGEIPPLTPKIPPWFGTTGTTTCLKPKGSVPETPVSVTEPDDAESHETDDHNQSDGPHFAPKIDLPDLVEVKTGEEDEEVLFCHRAKLYRFDDSQWKERGVGDIKVLKHKLTSKYRIVMRREQVLKLCANHYIVGNMQLMPHGTNGKSWTWVAQDFSDIDDKPQKEMFAVRFGNVDSASDFKEQVDLAVNYVKNQQVLKQPTSPSRAATAFIRKESQQQQAKQTDGNKPFGFNNSSSNNTQGYAPFTVPSTVQSPFTSVSKPLTTSSDKQNTLFSKPTVAGSWECPDCMVKNPPSETKCKCCGASNPSAPSSTETAGITQPKPFATSVFGASSTASPFSFGIKKGQDTTSIFGKPNTVQSDSKSTFSFGISQQDSNKAQSVPSTIPAVAAQPADSQKGSFSKPKVAGSWECPDCMVKNPPAEVKCACCGASNPSAPSSTETTAPKPSKPFTATVFAPPSGSSPFSFGIKQGQDTTATFGKQDSVKSDSGTTYSFGTKTEANKDFTQSDHRTLQRAGGVQPASGFSFAFASGSTAAKPFSFKPDDKDDPFKSGSGSGERGGGLLPKPRFPDVQDDGDEKGSTSSSSDDSNEEYSDDDEYSSDDEEEYDVEDGELDLSTHQSPMIRYQAQETKPAARDPDGSGDDVICVGEILPSKELQEKAKSMMLPPHFYNYLEEEKSKEQNASNNSESSESTSASDRQTAKKSEDQPQETKPTFAKEPSNLHTYQIGGSSLATFADLAATKSSFNFSGVKTTTPQAWQPSPKPMFSQQSEHEDPDNSTELYKDEERDDIHFEPIVKLPDKVAVVTGEEDEDTLYSQRSKLFRWDADASQWKERGVGDICIKFNKSTNRYRIVMRREQVLKVCANHYLTADLKLSSHAGSDRAWTWLAHDFSEGGESPVVEQFTIRFKNAEFAEQFKDKVQECQILMGGSSASNAQATTYINQMEKIKSELGYFKDKLLEKPRIDLENTITEGLVATDSSKFDPTKLALTPLVQRHMKEKNEAAKDTESKPSAEEVDGDKQKKGADSAPKSVPSIGLEKFEFKMKPNESPEKPKQRGISVCSATSEDSYTTDHIYFEPKIPLPDKVDVVTGEEEEQVLFGSRSKLFVFHRDSQEWKERGLGEIKLLQNTKSYKIRLVMRREQVLKVCLNHRVTLDMMFTNKDPKVLLWAATDFSDGDKPNGELLQFAIKFKTPEIASTFLEAVDEAKQAATEGKLMESFQGSIEQSYTTAPEDESIVSGGGDDSKSSQRSPVKPIAAAPLFSFANVESPLQKDFSKGFQFGENLFTKGPKPAADSSKFNFSSISFNFGSTSTPAPPSSQPDKPPTKQVEKPAVIKSLFGDGPPSTSAVTAGPSASQPSTQIFAKPDVAVAPFKLFSANSNNTKPDADAQEEKSAHPVPSAATPQDVIFVWEATPTDEQRQRANQLRLPPTFFLYEDETGLEDLDSDEEDRILDYIRRRDNPEEDAEEENQSQTPDQSRDETGEYTPPETPPPEEEIEPEPQENPPENPTESVQSEQEGGNLFGNFTSSVISFAAMASSATNNQSFGSRKDAAFNVSAADKVLFSNTEKEQDPEAYDPEYKPAMAEPPPMIEVKTGEEDEEVLFKERCKLYRFDEAGNAWKERGLGDMKILHHPTFNSYRVVMRREQVLKVCANHLIKPGMKLMSSTEKSWMYVAHDRAEGADSIEKFTVRFKYPEIANSFKQVWDRCTGQE